MSLPPGFLDELRTRVSISQVVGRKVVWDQRKSQQGRGDMWAPCPFHQEKSASFHVVDGKGFYKCFGCGASGDAITFVRETENVSFIEAVKILADEAGMPMPERDPRAQERSDRRSELVAVMDEAVKFYRLQLQTGAGGAARRYLDGRGLDPESQARWELGFAPDDWRQLIGHLKAKGISPELMQEAGLAKTSAKGGEPYDTFRNRIMFPIRDAQGRAIAFGGRAMDPADHAKYLNSPETALFDKGRQLYNIAPARRAAGRDTQLVVAEGYMDVIALSEAGFEATVAPLGTAITEDQLRLMWRIHDEPVLALDGDAAGQRAAMRAMDLALPLLEAGKSLRFCLLPQGQDPDDLLKEKGAEAMRALLADARPMIDLLWARETEGRSFDSPERRAALDGAFRAALSRIADPGIKRHYESAIRERLYAHFKPARRAWVPKGQKAPAVAVETTRRSDLASGEVGPWLRETVVLVLLIRHPEMVDSFAPALERVSFTDPDHARIADCLMTVDAQDAEGCRALLVDRLGPAPLEKLEGARHLSVVPAMRRDDPDMARQCIAEELEILAAFAGAALEIEEASQDIGAIEDEAITWRLGQAAKARDAAGRGRDDDVGQFDMAPNGVRLDRGERSAFEDLLRQIRGGSDAEND